MAEPHLHRLFPRSAIVRPARMASMRGRERHQLARGHTGRAPGRHHHACASAAHACRPAGAPSRAAAPPVATPGTATSGLARRGSRMTASTGRRTCAWPPAERTLPNLPEPSMPVMTTTRCWSSTSATRRWPQGRPASARGWGPVRPRSVRRQTCTEPMHGAHASAAGAGCGAQPDGGRRVQVARLWQWRAPPQPPPPAPPPRRLRALRPTAPRQCPVSCCSGRAARSPRRLASSSRVAQVLLCLLSSRVIAGGCAHS